MLAIKYLTIKTSRPKKYKSIKASLKLVFLLKIVKKTELVRLLCQSIDFNALDYRNSFSALFSRDFHKKIVNCWYSRRYVNWSTSQNFHHMAPEMGSHKNNVRNKERRMK